MSGAAETTIVEVVNLTLNGREVQARPGQTILEVARENGIDIPTLCHDPRLEPYGACRLCLVEVEGARGPMAACGAKVNEGMKVQTHTDKIVKLRKFVLELLLTNHPLDCPVCEAAGDCRLQDYAYEYLVDMVPWGWRAPLAGDPGNHPNIAHFGARCILCGRCVRICREIMSIGCWGYLNRGYDSEVDTPYRLPLEEVGCVSCGQCVSTCPVGAVTGQRAAVRRPSLADRRRCEPSAPTAPTVASFSSTVTTVVLCAFSLSRAEVSTRATCACAAASARATPMPPIVLRSRSCGTRLENCSRLRGRRLSMPSRVARRLHGSERQSFAAVCGAHVTNEAAYLLQKLARSVMGVRTPWTLWISTNAGGADKALERAMGSSRATATRKQLATADVIVVIGSNITDSNPVLSLAVVKAVREGKTVIVIDPRSDRPGSTGHHPSGAEPRHGPGCSLAPSWRPPSPVSSV